MRRLKYDPLREFLAAADPTTTRMTFEGMDRLVGGLPRSAWLHRAWWANDRSHVQASAWLDAGRQVRAVDIRAGWVEFGWPSVDNPSAG